jgi:hypothetical protein
MDLHTQSRRRQVMLGYHLVTPIFMCNYFKNEAFSVIRAEQTFVVLR